MKKEFVYFLEKGHFEKLFCSTETFGFQYFLRTFLGLKEGKMKDMQIFYVHVKKEQAVINEDDKEFVAFNHYFIIIINTYEKYREFVVVLVVKNFKTKEILCVLKLIFTRKTQKKPLQSYHLLNEDNFRDREFANVFQMLVLDLNQLVKLEGKNSIEKWMMFLAANNEEQRAFAAEGDLYLMELNCQLK